MVKEIAVAIFIPQCTVQEFADVVFETKATLAEYHKREGDPNAVISTWKDNKRIITFAVPLSGVPEVVKTAIGCSTLTIQETQQREWAADGSLMVKSDPILDIVGGSKFTTSAEFTVHNSAAQPGCEVTAKVVCAAAGPWGLVSTIEGIMAQQAEKSVQSFLEFCAERCREGAQALPDYLSDADTVELFQDAAESLLGAYPSSGDLAGLDLQLLEPVLEQLDAHARGMQASIKLAIETFGDYGKCEV
ncbi:hypothetical protein COCOBI_13-3070 [Coccomyxa sp. Obi]|nr:hypothetical protein COCOBI_13-3070 [Coccomyxa sp. Obi]